MRDHKRPETIENRWDILYRDYPEVYDVWTEIPEKPTIPEALNNIFNLKDRLILDIGSGAGKNAFELATYAKQVIGIEPADSMLKRAIRRLERNPTSNIMFLKGRAPEIPLKDDSVDCVIAITAGPGPQPDAIRRYVKDVMRVIRGEGFHAFVSLPPKGWYGGELNHIIVDRTEPPGGEPIHPAHDILPREFNYKHKDFFTVEDFGSVERIVSIYGFVFGREAIDYLRRHKKTTIKWKWRIYYRMKDGV